MRQQHADGSMVTQKIDVSIISVLRLCRAGVLGVTCHGTPALIQLPIMQLDRGKGKFADVIRRSSPFNDDTRILRPTIFLHLYWNT